MSSGFDRLRHPLTVEGRTELPTGIILFRNVIFTLVIKRNLAETSVVLQITCNLEQESKVEFIFL